MRRGGEDGGEVVEGVEERWRRRGGVEEVRGRGGGWWVVEMEVRRWMEEWSRGGGGGEVRGWRGGGWRR